MAKRIPYLTLLPFPIIGLGFIVASFVIDAGEMTDDGFPLNTFLLIMGIGFLVPLVIVYLVHTVRKNRIEHLMATGKQGEAVILSLEDTGVKVNDQPRVRMMLEVHIDGHSPYQVEKTAVIPLLALAKVQVGARVRVLADPREPENAKKLALML
jgi:hypothetical protein